MTSNPEPPVPSMPGREDSPFPSIYSDVTMDDYYFEEEDRDSPHNHLSSPMEYSDDTQSGEFSTRRLSGGSKNTYRTRNDSLRYSGPISPLVHFDEDGGAPGRKIHRGKNRQQSKAHAKQRQSAGDEENPDSSRKSARFGMKNKQSRLGYMEEEQTNWLKRLAYSFRSPVVTTKHATPESSRSRGGLNETEEYPHYSSIGNQRSSSILLPSPPAFEPWTLSKHNPRGSNANEDSPLMGTSHSSPAVSSPRESMTPTNAVVGQTKLSAQVAAAFLQDYEANRPPTFGGITNLADVSDYQMTLYHWKYSMLAEICRVAATLAFFASSYMEGFFSGPETELKYYFHRYMLTALNLFAITVFLIDMWVHKEIRGSASKKSVDPPKHARSLSSLSITAIAQKHEVRFDRSEKFIQALVLFCILIGLENVARLFLVSGDIVMFSSIFKPLVLFYVSLQARDAFAAVRRILRIVLRVLILELLLILMFAAVACRLFQSYDSFRSLGVAWLSLFELATSVVNPSIWMPLYNDSKVAAVFFIFFIVTTVFYMHSLVLSVVFQTYIHAAAEIHERNASDREDAVYLAFKVLLKQRQPENKESEDEQLVDVRLVRTTLRLMRPHYSPMKINALVDIVDPSGQGYVDYVTFRTKIRQALNASIRTTRNASNLAMSVELIAVAVAIMNFVYVILLSSSFNEDWFVAFQVEAGCFITLVAAFELLIRFNPLQMPSFTPLTRFNATFDGSALVAALISCIGIVMYLAGRPFALDCILIGRAIDMIRTMRFFQIFRDVVRRTSDVVPALSGPLVLLVTTLHVFVYVGMSLWGGEIKVGKNEGVLTELYDLNNFNSYQEGTVTIFQILAVNDWYAIAEVFLFATKNSSVYIVYPYFIIANLVCVSIMLNVLTAFFVESFVTKRHDDKDAPAEATATMHKERGFGIGIGEGIVRRVSSGADFMKDVQVTKFDRDADAESSASERYEFDVYEREGFDKIMQTVSGSIYHGDFARDICNYLEIYENLAPGRETVGYLVCDQQTLDRFGNRRFRTKAIGFLDENALHGVVTAMHGELLTLAPGTNFQDRSLIRTFPHKREPGKSLEIAGSLLRRQPALSLFVSRTKTADQNSGVPPLPGNSKR